MSSILVLNSSITGAQSISRPLVSEAVARIKAQHPGATVVERDLAAEPLPHLDAESAAVIAGAEPANEAQRRARELSDTLIAELKAADYLVIGAPMYNFGIASTLKSWFDYVLRARVTFRYSEKGPEGLMTGKRAVLVVTRNGFYSEGPSQSADSQEPHLRTLLGFIGITNVTVVRAEKLAFGPEARSEAIEGARAELAKVA